MTQYRLRRCRSHNAGTTPREFETVALPLTESDAIQALQEAETSSASGDLYHLTMDGLGDNESLEIDYDKLERHRLVVRTAF